MRCIPVFYVPLCLCAEFLSKLFVYALFRQRFFGKRTFFAVEIIGKRTFWEPCFIEKRSFLVLIFIGKRTFML